MYVTRYNHIIYQFMTSSLFSSHSIRNLMIEMLVGHLDSQSRWARRSRVCCLYLWPGYCYAVDNALHLGPRNEVSPDRLPRPALYKHSRVPNWNSSLFFFLVKLFHIRKCFCQQTWPCKIYLVWVTFSFTMCDKAWLAVLLEWQQGLSIISTKQ